MGRNRSYKRWLPPVLLALLTFAVYARSISCPLLYWDDHTYIYEDTRIQEISARNAWRIVATSFFSNYHPVATFTFAFDHALWGERLWGFHLTHLAFYAGGVVLLYFVFLAILRSGPAAFAAAAIYATHTIHVEPVVWLAGRKDIVCFFFYSAAILAYLRYAREKEKPYRHYALFAALAVAAMLSKGYAAILPVVLLAYDACFGRKIGRRQILDKLPLLAFAALLTVVLIAAHERDATPISPDITLWYRFVTLCKVFAVYVGRTILPIRLCACYVVDGDWLNPGVALLGALLGVASIGGFFALRRSLPAAAFGIALYLLQLGPVMNTFFTLRAWITDRYLLFPTIGSSLALAATGLWLYRNRALQRGLRRWAVPAAAIGVVALYFVLTVARIGVWKSGVAYWSDILRKQNGIEGSGPVTASEIRRRRLKDMVPRLRLAAAYRRAGELAEARALMGHEYLRDLESAGESSWLLTILHFIDDGRPDEAIRKLQLFVDGGTEIAPVACTWMGIAYEKKGEPEAARRAYLEATSLYKEYNRAGTWPLLKLGMLELKPGRFEKAAEWFRRAREEAVSSDPRPVFYLGLALENAGKVEEAYQLYEEVLGLEGRASPAVSFDFTRLHVQMGSVATKLGRRGEAVRHYAEVLRLAPDHPERANMLLNVGIHESKLGRAEEAVGHLKEVLRLVPDHPQGAGIRLTMALMEEKLGHTDRAYRLFEEVLRLAPDHPNRADIEAKIEQLRSRSSAPQRR